jgi:anti-anti-sigma factor
MVHRNGHGKRSAVRPGELRVACRRDEPGRLRLTGELELGTREILAAVAGPPDYRTRDLRLDASELSFVDCAGLATLVELARTTRANGLGFAITSASDALARLSALTGTRELLGVS